MIVETTAAAIEAGQRFALLPGAGHPQAGRTYRTHVAVRVTHNPGEVAPQVYGAKDKPATVTIVTSGLVFNVSPDARVAIIV